MLIQSRQGTLRLIRQHDHGLVSGELAAAWNGPLGSGAWDRVVVLATSLHDLGWRELDDPPVWDPETGRPRDFLAYPPDAKYEAAAEGIDRIEELHPYAAVLVSLHYTSFRGGGRPSEFEEAEEDRRVELLDTLEDEAPGPRQIQEDLQALRLFDNLSLFLCLTPPGADPDSSPSWLTPELLILPSWAGVIEERRGRPMELTWRDEGTVSLDPWLFEEELELEIPFRDLAEDRYPDADSLVRAWSEAAERSWTVRVAPLEGRPR